MSGMKIVIASNKRQDGISIKERKKAMIFYVCKTLYDVLHQVEGIFNNGMEFDGKKRQLCKRAY